MLFLTDVEMRCESWEEDSQYIAALIKNQKLVEAVETEEVADIITDLMNQEYLIFESDQGSCDMSTPDMAVLFDTLRMPEVRRKGILCVNNQQGILYASGEGGYQEDFRLDYHDVYITRMLDKSTQRYSNFVIIDNLSYGKVDNGIMVYNPIIQSTVDSFGLM